MLRRELITAVNRVVSLLLETEVIDIIREIRGGDNKTRPTYILNAFSTLSRRLQEFGDAEYQVIKIFNLEPIFTSEFWSEVMIGSAKMDTISPIHSSISFALRFLPKTVELLGRETDQEAISLPKGRDSKPTKSVLTIVILEEKDLSTPQRVILALQSVQELYEAVAQIHNRDSGDLSLISCDSGSDKSFDFLGAAQIVEAVKEIILSLWNKIIYFQEDKSGRQLELIAESLPILEKISAMREENRIEPERAELLKRQIMSAVAKFSKAGVTIPEIDQYTYYNPRQLMKPEPKLLLPPLETYAEEVVIKEEKIDQVKKPKRTKTVNKVNKDKDNKLNIDDPELAKYLLEKMKEYKKEDGKEE